MRLFRLRHRRAGHSNYGFFGDSAAPEVVQPRARYVNARDQVGALKILAKLTRDSLLEPHLATVRRAALAITQDCPARDDWCELEAIFEGVKHGNPNVPGLEKGMRYVADPLLYDLFTSPYRILTLCKEGRCAGDCDDQSSLVAALAASIGFQAGLNAWGRKLNEPDHVFAVVRFPKKRPTGIVALDTSADVGETEVGWHPPGGHNLYEWL